MSKYDILPFAIGVAVGAAAGWFIKTKYDEHKKESVALTDEELDYIEKDIESTRQTDDIIITEVAQKPTIEEIREKLSQDKKEAEYITEEEGYEGDECDIEVIDEDTFLNGVYTKEPLEYDPWENRVYDETGEEMINWQAYLPADMVDHFGFGTNDPNCLYVRNHRVETDYEVVRRVSRK